MKEFSGSYNNEYPCGVFSTVECNPASIHEKRKDENTS
jgi:hypothetical protein